MHVAVDEVKRIIKELNGGVEFQWLTLRAARRLAGTTLRTARHARR